MPLVKLTFPKSVSVYQDIELHGEETVVLSDYTLEGKCTNALFTNWTYKNEHDNIITDGEVNAVELENSLKSLIYGIDGNNDYNIKNAGADSSGINLGERFLEVIAFTLFKHPMAKAPIANDTIIISKEKDVANGVRTQFNGSSDIRRSLVEQLMKQDEERFNNGDNNPVIVPIKVGDVIQFIVKYNGSTKNSSKLPESSDFEFSAASSVIGKDISFNILVKLEIS